MEWISVKDRLPEINVDVKAKNGDGMVLDLFLCRCKREWRESLTGLAIIDNITHWMPLPEPPEE